MECHSSKTKKRRNRPTHNVVFVLKTPSPALPTPPFRPVDAPSPRLHFRKLSNDCDRQKTTWRSLRHQGSCDLAVLVSDALGANEHVHRAQSGPGQMETCARSKQSTADSPSQSGRDHPHHVRRRPRRHAISTGARHALPGGDAYGARRADQRLAHTSWSALRFLLSVS
jgi:hypothetical protein